MTHPLTPREKVAAAIRAAVGEFRMSDDMADSAADAAFEALASSGDHAPVAWRVKDFADGWIVCGSEQTAADLAIAMSGATVQPLYGPALIAEVAALRGENDRLAFETDDATLAALQSRATEAERKLAEAVGVVEWYGENARLARLIHSEGDAGRNALADDGGKRAHTFLSKEAERA